MSARVLSVSAVLFAACGSFEDPAIVLDLRLLAAVATPPEQVVPVDPANPLGAFAAVQPFEVCALVADPGATRGLAWSMSVCPPRTDLRCDPVDPQFVAAAGRIDDPDSSLAPQRLCATVPAGGPLLAVIRATLDNDPLHGFSGIDLNVALRVVPDGGGEREAVYAGKAARFSAQLPAERVANQNPSLDRIDAAVIAADGTSGEPVPLLRGRCVDQPTPLTLAVGQRLHLTPIEPPGAREDYVVPTFEGGSRRFTENLRYQWLAGAGDWTRASTGGTRDGAGNAPPLDTAWKPPAAADVGAGLDVPLWLIERDERGGAAWFEACVHVRP